MTTALKPPTRLRSLQPPPLLFPGSKSFKFPTTQLPTVKCSHSSFEVREVSYQPPGTQLKLLNSVSFSLPEKSFGLIFGQSGSGKTTLLQLLAGISKPTSGSIYIQKYGDDGNPSQTAEPLVPERDSGGNALATACKFRSGGLGGGGNERGFCIKVSAPNWKARADVVKLLKHLKKELTVLVVSHDLREFASLVDRSWRMEMGGNLKQEFLPL